MNALGSRKTPVGRLTALALLLVGLGPVAGCGLKGPLTMPEKSTNVVIRGPGGEPVTPGTGSNAPEPPSGSTGTAAPATPSGTAAPATPAPAKRPARPAPDDDRQPPPPLPGGNPGAHGG